MDEETRSRREIIFKVLSWGSVIYFLIVGFALNQHGLFELTPPEGNERLYQAQLVHVDALDKKSDGLKAEDPVEAARLGVEAAKIRAEVDEARKGQSDSWYRAVGLVVGVIIYALVYPLLILLVYRRTDPEGTLAERDPIPLRDALIYGITLSILTSTAAVMTAYQ